MPYFYVQFIAIYTSTFDIADLPEEEVIHVSAHNTWKAVNAVLHVLLFSVSSNSVCFTV